MIFREGVLLVHAVHHKYRDDFRALAAAGLAAEQGLLQWGATAAEVHKLVHSVAVTAEAVAKARSIVAAETQPVEPVESAADAGADGDAWVKSQTHKAHAELLRAGLDGRQEPITIGEKEFTMVDYALLIALLGGAVLLTWAFLPMMGGGGAIASPSQPAQVEPTDRQRREASMDCQRAMLPKYGGEFRPETVCICNSRVGLPESSECKKARRGR
jgi:hypothetical protein